MKDLHAAWRRGKLTVHDKRLVIAAEVEQVTVNAGVRGRAIVGQSARGPRGCHFATKAGLHSDVARVGPSDRWV